MGIFNPYSMASGKPPPPPQAGLFDPYGLSSLKTGAPNPIGVNANKMPGMWYPEEAEKQKAPGEPAQPNTMAGARARMMR